MKKFLLAILLLGSIGTAKAEEGILPLGENLTLMIPLKTTNLVYLRDFKLDRDLVGMETPVVTVWNIVEGTLGVVTSLEGQGTVFPGGNVKIGNLLQKWVSLPDTFSIGGYGGRDVNQGAWIYGLKASTKLWGN